MALGKEGQGHGALLTPLHPGHPGQAALPKPKEQYLPGWSWPCPGVTKELSSDLKPLWTRKYLSLRLSPQHHPVCDPLGTVVVPEGLCPPLPNAAGLRNLQETTHFPNSLGEAEEAQGTNLQCQCCYFLFWSFLLQDDFCSKGTSASCRQVLILASYCPYINTPLALPLSPEWPWTLSPPSQSTTATSTIWANWWTVHLYSAAPDNLQGTSRHEQP